MKANRLNYRRRMQLGFEQSFSSHWKTDSSKVRNSIHEMMKIIAGMVTRLTCTVQWLLRAVFNLVTSDARCLHIDSEDFMTAVLLSSTVFIFVLRSHGIFAYWQVQKCQAVLSILFLKNLFLTNNRFHCPRFIYSQYYSWYFLLFFHLCWLHFPIGEIEWNNCKPLAPIWCSVIRD